MKARQALTRRHKYHLASKIRRGIFNAHNDHSACYEGETDTDETAKVMTGKNCMKIGLLPCHVLESHLWALDLLSRMVANQLRSPAIVLNYYHLYVLVGVLFVITCNTHLIKLLVYTERSVNVRVK